MENEHERKMIREAADKMLLDAAASSEDGSWIIMLDDVKEYFDSTVTIDSGILPRLAEELKERDEVEEVIASEDCIQMYFVMQLNPDATPAELLSVIGYDPDIPEVLRKYAIEGREQSDEDDPDDSEEETEETDAQEQEEERGLMIGQT